MASRYRWSPTAASATEPSHCREPPTRTPVARAPGTAPRWPRPTVPAPPGSGSKPARSPSRCRPIFVDQQPQGVDSEVGQWSNDGGIDVYYDYGWYSGSIADTPGAVVEPVDYSGIVGTQTIVEGEPNQIQVFFEEVEVVDGQPNLLALGVNYAASADEIIGRCIVGSIDWNER